MSSSSTTSTKPAHPEPLTLVKNVSNETPLSSYLSQQLPTRVTVRIIAHGAIRVNSDRTDVKTFESPITVSLILHGRIGTTVCNIATMSYVTLAKVIRGEIQRDTPIFKDFASNMKTIVNKALTNKRELTKSNIFSTKKPQVRRYVQQYKDRQFFGTGVTTINVNAGDDMLDKIYTNEGGKESIEIIYLDELGITVSEFYKIDESYRYTLSEILYFLDIRGVKEVVIDDQSCNGFYMRRSPSLPKPVLMASLQAKFGVKARMTHRPSQRNTWRKMTPAELLEAPEASSARELTKLKLLPGNSSSPWNSSYDPAKRKAYTRKRKRSQSKGIESEKL
jgi:hypothetical protein